MTMTDINALANQLKSMTAKQLQQLLSATPNREGSDVRLKRNARTKKYFDSAPKPHQCLTYGVYRDITDYMAEIGTEAWLAQSVNHQTKNATFVRVRKQ